MNMENQLTKTPENLPEELLQEEGKFLEERMKRLEEKIGEFDGGSLDRRPIRGFPAALEPTPREIRRAIWCGSDSPAGDFRRPS